MPFFDYFAMEPLANWVQLNTGPGAAPLFAASTAYSGVNEALNSAATGTDGLSTSIENSWDGVSGPRAQAALRKHAGWVREQAGVAERLSRLAANAGKAHNNAVATMPTLAEILENMAKRAAASAAASAAAAGGPTTLPLAAAASLAMAEAEAEYLILRTRAAIAMTVYEADALDTLEQLASIEIEPPPPMVTGGGGGVDSTPQYTPPDTTGPLKNLVDKGPDSPYITADNPTGPQHSLGDGSRSLGDGTQSLGDGTQSVSDAANSASDLGQSGSPTDRALPDIERALSPGESPYTAEHGLNSGSLDPQVHDGLFGTTPYSTTLAGLSGGVVGFVSLGMMQGGLGAMSGAATGFRMPGNWTPGTGTAFGAGTGNTATAPMSRGVSRPGVSAPSAQMRRRRKEEDKDKPGKVFIPGEQLDVPVLERPPAIGVIEYDEGGNEEDVLVEPTLVGVLDLLGDEPDAENPERPSGR